MNRQEFFNLLRDLKDYELKRIQQAYWLAKAVHRYQKRDSGERYFEHCRRVAIGLKERGGNISANGIVIALLHDCMEDGLIPQGLLERLFGQQVARSIEILSKTVPVFDPLTGKIKNKDKKPLSEYYRDISLAPKLVRRIKLIDRLDNICLMEVWPEERQQRYIAETETYLLPIARATDESLAEEIAKECRKFRGAFAFPHP